MTTRILTALAVATLAMSGCATKGYVMKQVQAANDSSRTGWTAGDQAIRGEMTTQFSAVNSRIDSTNSAVATLRTDLNGLRDDFGAKVTAMEQGMQFAFPVTFAYDDSEVRTEARAALDRFVKVINKHYSGSVVTVEGFADPAGSESYNRHLSEERAESVIEYLRGAGINGVTLRPVGLGETRPVVEGASRDMPGAESNRRVVFVVESTGRVATGGN